MKTNVLIRLIVLLSITGSFCSQALKAQSIRIVPYLNQVKGSFGEQRVEFEGRLYFSFSGSSLNELAKYDGDSVTLISNEDSQYCQSCIPVIFNNKIAFDYINQASGIELGEYDGTILSHLPINIPGLSIIGVKVVYNNELFFLYIYQSTEGYTTQKLGKFDGTNFTTVLGPVGVDSSSYQPFGSIFIFDKDLYTTYINSSSGLLNLAKYNGSNFSFITNPNDATGVVGGTFLENGYIEYNGNLYFPYSNAKKGTGRGMAQLAKFDGTTISLIPGPDGSEYSTVSAPIVYNNTLCMSYKNANGMYQLAQYDGTSIKLISNPDASLDSTDFGLINYNNNLYFKYKNVSGTFQLAQYDGKSITLIPNPDKGIGYRDVDEHFYNGRFYPIVSNNNLYINYTDSSRNSYLAQYDGKSLTLITGSTYEGAPAIYKNALYFNVRDSLGYTRLAYLVDRTLPINLLNFKGELLNNDALLQWQTATEQNSNHFTIQRSKDGISFSNIGEVKATGSSTVVKSYNYTDLGVVKLGASKLFYRLQEVDNDGKKQLSNIVSINIATNNDQIIAFPNPAKNIINLQLPHQLSRNAVIVLYDVNGRKVLQQKPQSNFHQQLNISNQLRGNYTIEVIDNGKKIYTGKVMIMH